jgi:hypothetical protein
MRNTGYTLSPICKQRYFDAEVDLVNQLKRVKRFVKEHPEHFIESINTTVRFDDEFDDMVYSTVLSYVEGQNSHA